jgi:hypothetical protein
MIILGGGVLFAVWFEYLWQLVKALLPVALIGVGGVIAYFGWEEKKDRRGAFLDFSSPTEASRYQAEALAYQEKINGFSEEAGPADPEDSSELDVLFTDGLSADPAAPEAKPGPEAQAARKIEISGGSRPLDAFEASSGDASEASSGPASEAASEAGPEDHKAADAPAPPDLAKQAEAQEAEKPPESASSPEPA